MSGTKQKCNRLIREQCAGGDEVLDALELLTRIVRRHDEHTEAGQIARLALAKLHGIRNAMYEQVRVWEESTKEMKINDN